MPDPASPAADGPLAHVTVVEFTEDRGAFCGKLFADLGAQVIKVEPPSGDATRRMGPFKDDGWHRPKAVPL